MNDTKTPVNPLYISPQIRGTDIVKVEDSDSLGARVFANGQRNMANIWADANPERSYRIIRPALPNDTYNL